LRVRERDEAAGIETTEEEILQQVDLRKLDLGDEAEESENNDARENGIKSDRTDD